MNKAEEFDEIASQVFAPIYPVLVKQILLRTRVKKGACLDLGCGGGHLGLALAEISKCDITLYDISREALDLAKKRIKEKKLGDRVEVVCGNVHQMPFPDESFKLIISRGSLWFWDDHVTAFREIYRVLAPGGEVYIGGGFGTKQLREKIINIMNRRENGNWEDRIKSYRKNHTPESIKKTIENLGITGCQVIDDESGTWFHFKKPETLMSEHKERMELRGLLR